MNIVRESDEFRIYLDKMITMYPELFPDSVKQNSNTSMGINA